MAEAQKSSQSAENNVAKMTSQIVDSVKALPLESRVKVLEVAIRTMQSAQREASEELERNTHKLPIVTAMAKLKQDADISKAYDAYLKNQSPGNLDRLREVVVGNLQYYIDTYKKAGHEEYGREIGESFNDPVARENLRTGRNRYGNEVFSAEQNKFGDDIVTISLERSIGGNPVSLARTPEGKWGIIDDQIRYK